MTKTQKPCSFLSATIRPRGSLREKSRASRPRAGGIYQAVTFSFKVLQNFIVYESAEDRNLRAFSNRKKNSLPCNVKISMIHTQSTHSISSTTPNGYTVPRPILEEKKKERKKETSFTYDSYSLSYFLSNMIYMIFPRKMLLLDSWTKFSFQNTWRVFPSR